MKRVTLCADDYGQTNSISEGILALLAAKRLTAVSCLTSFPAWQQHAKPLLPYKNRVDIGLHFNLTENKALFPSLQNLMIKAYLRQIEQRTIEHEFNRQLDLFSDEMGQLPDFIDGHEHVHHLPIVRTAILNVYEKRLRTHRPYLRVATNGTIKGMLRGNAALHKTIIINLTGALALKHLAKKNGIPHNQSFAGIYDFKKVANFPNYFRYFLSQITHNGLIMCHPGLKTNNDENDSLALSRWQEYQYFNSEQFNLDCEQHNVKISRFKEAL